MSGRRAQQILSPEVLRWARERASLAPEQLAAKMRVKPDRLRDWESSWPRRTGWRTILTLRSGISF